MLSSVQILCGVCVKERWDEGAAAMELRLEKNKANKKSSAVADFDRLISFGFIRPTADGPIHCRLLIGLPVDLRYTE